MSILLLGVSGAFRCHRQAMTLFGIIEDPEFFESRIPYTVDVILTLDVSDEDIAFTKD